MKKLLLLLFGLNLPFSAAWAVNETTSLDDIERKANLLETGNSHTYIRCWYRLDQTHKDTATDFKWAKKENSDDYYSIQGTWRHKFSGKNMFYTEISQSDIRQRCVDTLGMPNNEAADIIFFASNETWSFNQTIWSQDTLKQEDKINKIIAFGDSLSDTGNLFNGSEWRFPDPNSWFLGHFSNGLVWPEYLANSQNIPLYNWAVGGAAGTNQYKVITGLDNQITSYFDYIKKAKNYQPKNTLFTLEIGLNDFMNYDRSVNDVSNNVTDGLRRLIDNGGAEHILLWTLPDATRSPQFKYATKEKVKEVRAKIDKFNIFIKSLAEYYKKSSYYKKKGIDIVLLDVHAIFEDMINHPNKYDLVNVTDSCLDINRANSVDYLLSHTITDNCDSVGSDNYLFWGVTHPTTAVHKIFADKIIETGIFDRHHKQKKNKNYSQQ